MSGLRITLLELQPYSAPRVTLLNMKHFLKARLEKSITVAGTQKLHAFYSIHGRHQLVVKRYSNSGESLTANVVKV